MIIVSNTTVSNEIKFIPRVGTLTKAVLTDEVTGEVIEESPIFTVDGYYSVCTLIADLVDQRKYNLKILGATNEVLYKDLLFCSTQPNEDYSISNGELDYSAAPVESTPKFIIID